MGTKHTPGPWVARYMQDDGEHVIRMGEAIDTPYSFPSEQIIRYDHGIDEECDQLEIAHANTRLIASAPELLAACQAVVASGMRNAAYDACVAAIAKATGA